MSPEDLQRCLDLLEAAADELGRVIPVKGTLPRDLESRLTKVHVGIESLRLSTQSLQLTLSAPVTVMDEQATRH